MAPWKVIAISGATNAGKTCLTKYLSDYFEESFIINQDEFFYSENNPNHTWITLKNGHKHQNWEILTSVDFKSLNELIVDKYNNHDFGKRGLLIVEGHLLLNWSNYTIPFDLKFFLTLSKTTCYSRRVLRTYIPPDPEGYFDEYVWPFYLYNKNLLKDEKDIIYLDGEMDNQKIIEEVIKITEGQTGF